MAARGGDRAKACHCFRLALRADPDNLLALLWLGRLVPDRQERLALFSRVLELDPDNDQACAGIRSARRRSEPDTASLDVPAADSPPDVDERRHTDAKRSVLVALLPRLAFGLGTLLLIAYIVFWGLTAAEQARAGASAGFWNNASLAAQETARYFSQRLLGPPETYAWQRTQVPAPAFVWMLLKRSAVLLLTALAIASTVGVTLGILAAKSRRVLVRTLLPLVSIVAISVPSFMIGMLFLVINFGVHRRFGITVLPPTGYGLDTHLILPALVLAARPLAQITGVTYALFSDILQQDYIRTAIGKGLPPRRVLWGHAFRSGLAPILTTMMSGLRFSLSSLPVVEYFFVWPGLGLALLRAIEQGNAHLAADLILTLGILFIVGNLLLETAYRFIDPRVAQAQTAVGRKEGSVPFAERAKDLPETFLAFWRRLIQSPQRIGRRKVEPVSRKSPQSQPPLPSAEEVASEMAQRAYQRRQRVRAMLTNVPFVVGTLLVLGLFVLALFGDGLAPTNPYQTSGVRYIEGEIWSPPFPPTLPAPSSILDSDGVWTYLQGWLYPQRFEYPWGSDPVGRDMMSLVLVGAKLTLALGLFATLARVILGTVLGILAGWSWGGRLDRFISGFADTLQAFPALLFAMVLILALDIRKGMAPFIIALALVGWGEVMQLVRSQVISLRNLLFIESAVAIGAGAPQIFVRHFLPNLLPTLIPVATLEMAGVLLLLAELGFLNIFIGGGAAAEVFVESAKYHYSDVPEWGALLSNIRVWWRSYPWMAWYPGLFFAGAILAFNLWGEGLRHLLGQVGFNLGRLFNRYTIVLGGVLVLALVWTLRSTAPLGLYAPQSLAFNAANVVADVERLSSPEFSGREAGTDGSRAAAEYIAARMKEVGLQPAGSKDTYLQSVVEHPFHLSAIPELVLVNDQGAEIEAFTYRQDYVEVAIPNQAQSKAQAPVLLTLLGAPSVSGGRERYGLDPDQTGDSILLVTSLENLEKLQAIPRAGALVVVDDPAWFERRYLLSTRTTGHLGRGWPAFGITPQVAERLLGSIGDTDLEQLRRREAALSPGESVALPLETQVELAIDGERVVEEVINVIGFIPGGRAAEGLDDQVIMIAAYYDGLGTGPDGTIYPGANDNASGVATMLEIARAWRDAPYQPRKTIIFVAWAGGEQHQSLSVFEVMNAKIGFATNLEVEAVIELSGVGAGDGSALLIAEGSSYRLTQLFRAAGRRLGAPTTVQGKHAHTGLYRIPPLGGRSALTAIISWEGSDALAHTPLDTVDSLDTAKIEAVGRTVFLVATVMGREVEY